MRGWPATWHPACSSLTCLLQGPRPPHGVPASCLSRVRPCWVRVQKKGLLALSQGGIRDHGRTASMCSGAAFSEGAVEQTQAPTGLCSAQTRMGRENRMCCWRTYGARRRKKARMTRGGQKYKACIAIHYASRALSSTSTSLLLRGTIRWRGDQCPREMSRAHYMSSRPPQV